jgi:hypothetical protein
MDLAKEGMKPFVTSSLPKSHKKARRPPPEKFDLVASKLKTIVERGYVQPGYVRSLTDYFDVPKGEDIRLVYNGSSCGLNAAVWAPNFWLPYPRTALRSLDYNYYSVDMDLGEMFLNFPLHTTMQPYAGIDLTPFLEHLGLDKRKSGWLRWTRNWMGARPSPYSSVRFYYLAEEFCKGNRTDLNNPLRWDKIILNLPGSVDYDPTKPRLYKWDSVHQRIAGDLSTFVDDLRITGQTVEHAWHIARVVASRLQYLGIQEASRKRRPPTRSPGAWAGSIFKTDENQVTKTVATEKWLKGQRLVNDLWTKLNIVNWKDIELSYKDLEVTRGFLGHLSMTYEVLVPYLKGFHLTLASFLPKRDEEGWRMNDKAWAVYVEAQLAEGKLNREEFESMSNHSAINPPRTIKPVAQLKDDVYALHTFFQCEEPPIINDRSNQIQVVSYGFGDASGTGFGSLVQTAAGISYRIGVWGTDDEGESSNFREFQNVVEAIETEINEGRLRNSVLFFFTDNC